MPHTPGPWVIGDVQWIMHQKSGLGYSYRPINSGALEVAQVWEDDKDCEMEDNVRLIAAAPELLECCRRLLEIVESEYESDPEPEDLDSWRDAIQMTTGCIAKAEGRDE